MTAVTPYTFESHQVRTVEADSQTWFIGKDVCAALGIANHSDALGRLDEDERKDGVAITDPIGRKQEAVAVSEAGVFRLIFTSRVEAAERFKRWLAHDVLPQIHHTGAYQAERLITVKEHKRIVAPKRKLAQGIGPLPAPASHSLPKPSMQDEMKMQGEVLKFFAGVSLEIATIRQSCDRLEATFFPKAAQRRAS